MLKRQIGTRYAKALFELARETDKLEAVERDFPIVMKTLDENPDFESFLLHPAIVAEEKKKVIASLLEDRIDAVLFDFINLVVDKSREEYLHIIREDFDIFLMEHRSRQTATVYTPFELSAETRKAIEAGLTKSTGRTVTIEEVVDPALIGGIKVQIGDRVFDGSIRSGLDQIREELGSARV